MDKKLQNAVIRQLTGNTKIDDDTRVTLRDVANHGADGGFTGFIYYSETVKFFKRNRRAILELVKEYAREFEQTPLDFVHSFNVLKPSPPDKYGGGYTREQDIEETQEEIARALYGRLRADDTQVPNALAWFALEEVAREITDNTDAE